MYSEHSNYEGNSGFVAGMLAGVTVGLGLGMLFAPRPGSEIRRTLAGSATDLKRAAADTYRQTSDKVRDIVDRGRDTAREAIRTAQGSLDEARRGERSGFDPATTPATGSSYSSSPASGL